MPGLVMYIGMSDQSSFINVIVIPDKILCDVTTSPLGALPSQVAHRLYRIVTRQLSFQIKLPDWLRLIKIKCPLE